MMSTEDQAEEIANNPIRQDRMRSFALRIVAGEAGHDFIYCLEQGKFLFYDNGYWHELYDIDLIGMIEEGFPDILFLSMAGRKNIVENLKTITRKKLSEFNKFPLINLENYMLDPVRMNVVGHDKSYYSTVRVPYKYDALAECPLWIKSLDEIFEGNKQKHDLFQEFCGYCLVPDVSQKKALLLLGDSNCLGGETPIYDPIKKIAIPISEIKDDFHVEAWDGNKVVIAKASKPFMKDVDNLYTVSLSNGKSFVCSKSHLVLTQKGYQPLGELTCGDELFLPSTNLDNDPSDHKQGASRYSHITPSSLSDYLSYPHLYGEQPLSGAKISQDASPSLADVRVYDSGDTSLRSGVQDNKEEHTHLCQPFFHPSNEDVCLQKDSSLRRKLIRAYSSTCELISHLLQAFLQPKTETCPEKTTSQSCPSDNNSYSKSPYNTSSLVITSIVYKRRDVKWDITVPKYHNYLCGGAVHHNSGKSTVLFILRSLIGDANCSSVPLKHISNPQYTPLLINKMVNIDADVDKNAASYEAEFKTITTGEPVSCNQKHIPTFEFIPKCKIVMAANIFPKITDHSSAFYKRLILIPCDRIFEEEEQNKNLVNELKVELPGILNWAMAGLRRLRARGRFEQHEFMREAVQELEDDNNPVNEFIKDHVEIAMGQEVEKGELFDKYKRWSESTKTFTLSKARFGSCIFKRFHRETPKNTSNPITNKRIWRNLKYVEIKGVPVVSERTWE